MNCSVARSLDQVGEWWSLLIVRECLLGTSRFDDFQQRLGIARNVLTSRLNSLIEYGVLEKVIAEGSEKRSAYKLTPKGEALFPVIVALSQWGDEWLGHEAPLQLVENKTGLPIEPVGPRVGDRLLALRDVRVEPGPGATEKTMEAIRNRNRVILGEE